MALSSLTPKMPRSAGYLSRMIAEQMRNHSQNDSIRPAVDPGFFRVSNTKDCPRAVQYGRLSVPPSNPFQPDVLEKMAKGDLLHDRIRQVLIPRYTPYRVAYHEPEITLKGVFTAHVGFGQQETIAVPLEGHCDGLLYLLNAGLPLDYAMFAEPPLFNPKALLEIKSTSFRGYKATAENVMQAPHYSASYIKQGFRYIALWNQKYPHQSVDQLCVFMYDVNGDADSSTGLPMKDYWFEFSPKMLADDLQHLAMVERDVRDGKVSPKGYESKTDWHCKGCLWCDTCWGKRARKPQHAPAGRPEKPGAARADRVARTARSVERRSARPAARTAAVLDQVAPRSRGRRSSQRTSARQAPGRKGVGSRQRTGR